MNDDRILCPDCGHDNHPDFTLCVLCGASLVPSPPPPRQPTPPPKTKPTWPRHVSGLIGGAVFLYTFATTESALEGFVAGMVTWIIFWLIFALMAHHPAFAIISIAILAAGGAAAILNVMPSSTTPRPTAQRSNIATIAPPTATPRPRPTKTPKPNTSNTFTSPSPSCRPWQQAAKYVGTYQCICGDVSHAKSSGKNYFIHFDTDRISFYGVSWTYYWPANTFEGHCLAICGDVVENYGRPRIVIADPDDQLFECPSTWSSSSAPAKPKPTNTPIISYLCYINFYNCEYFLTQAEAQACYDYCMSHGYGDVHILDADEDGSACELLP